MRWMKLPLMTIKNHLIKNNTFSKRLVQGFVKLKSLPYAIKTSIIGLVLLVLTIPFYLSNSSNRSYHPAEKLSAVHSDKESIAAQIEYLNQKTPLQLVYNKQVEEYIQLFSGQRSNDIADYLSRSALYFPIIEAFLDKYNLPLELKYLAVVESGLNPEATSKSGAKGLWQFLYNTCKLVDLEVNSYIDERYDVYKSTDAACRYLNYLYNNFGNWELAMAAYNSGPGPVRYALEREQKSSDFWTIQPYLPEETQHYIPAIIAMHYMFEYAEKQGIEPSIPKFTHTTVDTIRVKTPLYFNQITRHIDISPDELKLLNPVYTKNYIPWNAHGATLVLPKKMIPDFIRHERKILNAEITSINTDMTQSNSQKVCITHVVQPGEFFHKLALRYNCSVEHIKSWNNIDTNALYPGQELKIWIEKNL